MDLEEKDRPEEAYKIFLQAWNEASNDFEKFLAAYYITRHQKLLTEKINWQVATLQLALKINDHYFKGILPSLYLNIATSYKELGDSNKAKNHYDLAASLKNNQIDYGPFYHGTKADLKMGDLLTAGFRSNYKPEIKMNHIYFSAMVNGAGLAAEIAKGVGNPRVYIVEPTGSFENDPNVTDKKFPGNPTRSYRSQAPLKIIAEVSEWERLPAAVLQKWREKIDQIGNDSSYQIIN